MSHVELDRLIKNAFLENPKGTHKTVYDAVWNSLPYAVRKVLLVRELYDNAFTARFEAVRVVDDRQHRPVVMIKPAVPARVLPTPLDLAARKAERGDRIATAFDNLAEHIMSNGMHWSICSVADAAIDGGMWKDAVREAKRLGFSGNTQLGKIFTVEQLRDLRTRHDKSAPAVPASAVRRARRIAAEHRATS